MDSGILVNIFPIANVMDIELQVNVQEIKILNVVFSGSGRGGSINCIDHHAISSVAFAIVWETKTMSNGNDGTKIYVKMLYS